MYLSDAEFEAKKNKVFLASGPFPDGSYHLILSVASGHIESWVPLPDGGWSLAPN